MTEDFQNEEGKKAELESKIYEAARIIFEKNLDMSGLVAVLAFGSLSEKKWRVGADIDADLIFQAPINLNHALQVVSSMKADFSRIGVDLDIRICADMEGNGIWLHNEAKLMRHPTDGKVSIKGLYHNPVNVYSNRFSKSDFLR